MPRKSQTKTSAGVQPSKGTKKTFDEDDLDDQYQPVASGSSAPRYGQSDSEDEDSDDAPEAVGMRAGRAAEVKAREDAERLAETKKQAARARNQKIAAAKSKPVETRKAKGKGKQAAQDEESQDEDVDEETRRLRARMAKAMASGDGDSEDEQSFHTDTEGGGVEDDLGDSEDELEGSFHTDSEDGEDDDNEESDQDGEEGVDDDSETLEDGPIDDATRRMRERMQAAMEAAERRAGLADEATTKPVKSAVAPTTKSVLKRKAPAPVDGDDDSQWDLSVGVGGPKPLSATVLRAAEEAEQEKKRLKAEKAAQAEAKKLEGDASRQKKRKVKKEESGRRTIGENRSVQLLAPTLDLSAGGLPPVVDARKKVSGQAPGLKSQRKFMKTAMKASGQLPGRDRTSGRKMIVAGPR